MLRAPGHPSDSQVNTGSWPPPRFREASPYPGLDRVASGPERPTNPDWQASPGTVPSPADIEARRPDNPRDGRPCCAASLSLRLRLIGLTSPVIQNRRQMIQDLMDDADSRTSHPYLRTVASVRVNSYAPSSSSHAGFRLFSPGFHPTFHLSLTLLVRYRPGEILRVGGNAPPPSARNSDPAYSGTPPRRAFGFTAKGVSPSTPDHSRSLAFIREALGGPIHHIALHSSRRASVCPVPFPFATS